MPFKLTKSSSTVFDNPEALFRDLRSRKVVGLLAHQADILREYMEKAQSESDVAFQLPTGSGKTLVGLLLAEWRRRKLGERVVYLCPTNQLVYQVVSQAKSQYGINALSFTGKKDAYPNDAKSEYQSSEVIAVTTYSSLFNISPFFTNPNLIILDDAHSAESYIANQWSLRIERVKHKPIYQEILSIVGPTLSSTDYARLTHDLDHPLTKAWVDKVPTLTLIGLSDQIVSVLDEHLDAKDAPELFFAWKLIRDHLSACHLYVSAHEFLMRPFIPPTYTHTAFTNANQRVYMSATLGEGGELERISGRKKIYRLSVPVGWDKQGIGRRLFFFPERSLNDEQSDELDLGMLKLSKRGLVLVPDDKTGETISKVIREKLGFKTFNAKEIEQSKTPFTSEEKAVAVVANRYDGIDFPDDQCRLIILHGLPRATNLQESFLITRIGASALLNDRILTRTVQAFGRCTRSATDYAAIVIRGDELSTFLQTSENRLSLHPELQAELAFGLDQSKGLTQEGFIENLGLFLRQTPEWTEADDEITQMRDSLKQTRPNGTQDLRESVAYEVDYQRAIWDGDHITAHNNARTVLGNLSAEELRGYRAWWSYLAGSAAMLATKESQADLANIARAHFANALSAAPSVRWLNMLKRFTSNDESDSSSTDPQLSIVIERLEVQLDRYGVMNDQKYAKEEKFILDNLAKTDSKEFEPAHERLGSLLGFESGKVESSGSPDPWWLVDDSLCFVFEDHSNAQERTSLSIDKARQVATHPNWVRANLHVSTDAVIIPVLITPVKTARTDALPHLAQVSLWQIDSFRTWVQNALRVLRELRSSYTGSGNLRWRAQAMKLYRQNKISPIELREMLSNQNAAVLLGSSSAVH
jgi:hypothetical protein